MVRAADLIGQKFGKLMVIERMENYRGKAMWKCECDCIEKNIIIAPTGRLNNGDVISCGCFRKEKCSQRSGENHPHWNGGRYVAKDDGYAYLRKPKHPNAKSNGYIREHIYVMSEHLGRPLKDAENVHHKNGIRDDNRIENLELWSTKQPPGQRVEDKINFCKDFLKEYCSQQDLVNWINSFPGDLI